MDEEAPPKPPAVKPAFMPAALRVRRQETKPARGRGRPAGAMVPRAAVAKAAGNSGASVAGVSGEEPSESRAEAKRKRAEQDAQVAEMLHDLGCSIGAPPEVVNDSAEVALQEVVRFSWAAPCRQLETTYERIRTIGRGRSGVVHLARHKALGDGGDGEAATVAPEGERSEHAEGCRTDATVSTSSLVAFKRLHSQMSANSSGPGQEPGVMTEAVREVQILSSVRHPNVVALEEVCTSGKGHTQTWYAVMEYVEYELGSLLEFAQQPLSEAQVKGLMQQLLRGMRALHGAWVVHRDLKMPNLLVSKHGVLKVCDFGLARFQGSDAKKAYTPGVVSQWYRSPELLLGATRYGAEVDMWAVGCLLAELCTRTPLFPGTSELDQLRRIFATLGNPTEASAPHLHRTVQAKGIVLPPAGAGKPLRQCVPRTGFDPRDVHGNRYKTTALSDEGFDLLTKLLEPERSARLSAAAALEHPWFAEAPRPETVPEETLALLRQQYSAGVQASAEAAKAKRVAATQQQAAAAFNPQVQAQLAAAQRVAAMISQQQQGMGLMQGMGIPGPR